MSFFLACNFMICHVGSQGAKRIKNTASINENPQDCGSPQDKQPTMEP